MKNSGKISLLFWQQVLHQSMMLNAVESIRRFKIPHSIINVIQITLQQTQTACLNVNVLKTYARMFPECILGLSDHTKTDTSVLAAVSLNARIMKAFHVR